MLYPLKFKPIFKERPWGGRAMSGILHKRLPEGKMIGESWELSTLGGDISVVSSGALKGNELNELIEVYMGDLVGDRVYERFGEEFPLIIKFIDARERLSIQVHPGDRLAVERHNAYGKAEMWYVVDAEPGSYVYIGFKAKTSREEYLEALESGTLTDLLNRIEVRRGDAYYIPQGTIHTLGGGIVVAEIQQTSDITYRIDDWGRTDGQGNRRELNTDLAEEAIDFNACREACIARPAVRNNIVNLIDCDYFTVNIIALDGALARDYSDIDSFVAYVCVGGSFSVGTVDGSKVRVKLGESVLVPAEDTHVTLDGRAEILEVYLR